MKRLFWGIPVTFLVLVIAFMLVFPTYVWRQKTTVIIDTPNGLKSGSSVVEMCAKMHPAILPQTGHLFPTITGEAVVIELDDGQYLFALLDGGFEASLRIRSANEDSYRRAFLEEMPDLPWYVRGRKAVFKRWMRMVPTLQDPASVPADFHPPLVMFTDIADPKSAQRILPSELPSILGDGYTLHSITIEATKDPITNGPVNSVLTWLDNIGDSKTTFLPTPPERQRYRHDLGDRYLSSGAFSTELYPKTLPSLCF